MPTSPRSRSPSQEDAGIDVVGDGEQSRQHFVHGFLAKVEGIDFPEAAQAINDYPIAVLEDSKNAATAQAFVDLVRSADGASALTAAGFDVP